jgi:hypothetical protein
MSLVDPAQIRSHRPVTKDLNTTNRDTIRRKDEIWPKGGKKAIKAK